MNFVKNLKDEFWENRLTLGKSIEPSIIERKIEVESEKLY